jgi:hypothetical protein
MGMSEKEKPLPQPPSTPFGLKKRFEQPGDDSQLVADQLAMAMAEGKLDEYIEQEMPDNEYARKLAMMMMGMSGMADIAPPTQKDAAKRSGEERDEVMPEAKGLLKPPEDLVKAAVDGDVKGLMEMLRREHEKNNPGSILSETHMGAPADKGSAAGQETTPVVEKEIVVALAAIADENGLTMDWLILRAMKLYVEEYKKTGRL